MVAALSTFADPATPLYERVAARLSDLIEGGTFRAGDRLPSVRQLSREWDVSITTVSAAYQALENREVIETRPQSGHYVRARLRRALPEPAMSRPTMEPAKVSVAELTIMLLHDCRDQAMATLGIAAPNPDHLPAQKLNRMMSAIARRIGGRSLAYEHVPGNEALRSEIARRMMHSGCALTPQEILVTGGCMEAVQACLRAVTKPGDAVAVESPTYFGFLRAMEGLGLRAVEIPTHPRDGICLDALRYAIEHHNIRAVLTVPSFSNPTGSCMSEERREELVRLITDQHLPLIEDDIYGDLSFTDTRPKAAKAFDREGLVLYCSSFSKTLAPGYRVGWVAGGRFHDRVEQVKTESSCSTGTLPQMTIAEFLANGGYDHHLRSLRRTLARQTAWLIDAITRHFPQETRVSHPTGGFTVWVELPKQCDTVELYHQARQRGVQIAPGILFSARGQYRNGLRLSSSFAAPKYEKAVAELGKLAKAMAGERRF